ncbi:MAG TPA: hypothetical protein VJR22_05885 [Candidatus Nitrosotalea sp.]|nr:hypothetical protein [Candidatus Nitrosotalea sp.]
MKNLFLPIIIASIVVATIASISLFFNPGHQSPCKFCPEQYAPNQPLQIRDITTAPEILTNGKTFIIYANVYNPNPYSVFINSGCVSSLSAIFDQHVNTTNNALAISCPAIERQEIPTQQEARIVGPSTGITYNATSVGTTNATITVKYEDHDNAKNATISKQFTIGYPGITPLLSAILPKQTSIHDTGIVPEDKKIPSYFCTNQEYFTNGSDVFLICHHVSNFTSNVWNLPDPEYKYTVCGGCALGFAYVEQIPPNLLSDQQKQQAIDKVLQMTGLKKQYPDLVLDHFLIRANGDSWFANVQFMIPHIMNGYGHCGWYTASDVNLDTLEVSPSQVPIGNKEC